MLNLTVPKLEYLFIAECLNGNIIKQTPEDKSRLDPTKSAFYDVVQNLPLKSFALVGKGHLFLVDFRDLSIHIDGKVHHAPKQPPAGAKIVLIYWHDTIQVSQSQLQIEKGIISGIKKLFMETKHFATIRGKFTIGWESFVNGKKFNDFTMKIE